MTPIEIRIALLRRDYTQRRICREIRRAPQTVSTVIYGHGKSRRVARYISKVTGIPVSILWPGRYPDLEWREMTQSSHRSAPASPSDVPAVETTDRS